MEFEVMVDVAMAANASITLGIIGGVLGNDVIAVWNGHALAAVLEELFASRQMAHRPSSCGCALLCPTRATTRNHPQLSPHHHNTTPTQAISG